MPLASGTVITALGSLFMLVHAVLTWFHMSHFRLLPAQACCTATSMTVTPSAQTCIGRETSEGFVAQHDAMCAAKLMGPGWQRQLVPRVPDPVQSQKGLRRAAGRAWQLQASAISSFRNTDQMHCR